MAAPSPCTAPPSCEATVLLHVARGLSNLEICEATGLSISVVKAHLRAAHERSGLLRRLELAAWLNDSTPSH